MDHASPSLSGSSLHTWVRSEARGPRFGVSLDAKIERSTLYVCAAQQLKPIEAMAKSDNKILKHRYV
jgi:hypothetical protein